MYSEIFCGFGFLAVWLGASAFNSIRSGWWELSKTHKFIGKYTGNWVRPIFRGVGFGDDFWGNNLVRFGADVEGLYMSVEYPFRFGHPPLFFPWDDVVVVREGSLMKDTHIILATKVKMRISNRIANELAELSRGVFVVSAKIHRFSQ